jgi:hypothetical protein
MVGNNSSERIKNAGGLEIRIVRPCVLVQCWVLRLQNEGQEADAPSCHPRPVSLPVPNKASTVYRSVAITPDLQPLPLSL